MLRSLIRSISHQQLVVRPQVAVRRGLVVARQQPRCFQVRRALQPTVQGRWYSSPAQQCWQCGAPTKSTSVLCENADCKAIQPVQAQVNYFDLLLDGKEHTFDVDTKAMRFKFLTLQQKAHPDSFSQSSKQEHAYAQLQSSMLNKAYGTLKDPLARARYMLELEGVEVSETESLHDPELLMEVMELREELDEVSTEEELAQVKQTNDAKYQETVQNLSKAFEKKDLDHAKELMVQLQYWETIRRAIVEWSPQ
ncbi:Co-chaperone HscB, C-terminal oligomerization domain-containing protein [Zychaea mexicana]|uniref:Co-chaperone HscB, C-terminal oligomerization domain-containing protein n=1 Tax=Zychaea mexicana TaxID=64656 RepID=UPI0022FE3748|nr:Co-chaperone HscB, C-terminal oligomerization domain-containing protein [Zychaea mexicana]KAI9476618.1 Co-chaperone HscB, C-terminal oligomerization domain-containing protein [Zychaea mexicana]